MSKKNAPIADHIKPKRKDFIISKDSVIDAIRVEDSFKIIAGKND